MASRGEAQTLTYLAWDTVNNVPKTGDVANHATTWTKDGTTSSTTNSPSEINSTNNPGLCKVVLTSTESDCNIGTLHGKSSTSGVYLIPVQVSFERLPTVQPAASGGLPTVGSSTGQISLSSGAVTVGTNNDKTCYTASTVSDKTGYSLTQAFPSNFSSLSIGGTGYVTAAAVTGNIGGDVLGNVQGDVQGNLNGDVQGQLLGDVVGNVTGDVQGKVLGSGVSVITAEGVWALNDVGESTMGRGDFILHEGAAQAGATTTITLASGASSNNSSYVNRGIRVTLASGLEMFAVISSYNGTTKVATVDRTWPSNPSNTSSYQVLASVPVELGGITHTGATIPTVTTTGTATNVTTVNGLAANVITAASLATDAGQEIADAVLLRNVSNTEASAGEHTLTTVILATLEAVRTAATTLTIYRTDGTTTHATKTLTQDASAEPITGIS